MDKIQELQAQLEEHKLKAQEILENDSDNLLEIENCNKQITDIENKLKLAIKAYESKKDKGEDDEKGEGGEGTIKEPKAEVIKKEDFKNKQKEMFADYVRGKISLKNYKNKAKEMELKNQLKEGTVADGGATVPIDDDTSIIKLREADDALQNYITVIPVTTNSGKKTVRIRKTGGTNFAKVAEGSAIGVKPTPTYKKIDYSVDKYGAIYDITEEFEEDTTMNIVGEMNEWIGNDSRELRNKLILDKLNEKSKTPLTGIDDIKKVLNVTLNTKNARYAKVLTNQTGFNWLSTLKDKQDRYMLQQDPSNAEKYFFGGKQIIVIDDSVLPNDTSSGTKAPIIIGDLMMAVVMFDRRSVTVKVTQEGKDAFENDLTLMKATEREDIQTLDDLSFVYGQVVIA